MTRLALVLSCVVASFGHVTFADDNTASSMTNSLTVGSDAPKIDIEHWISSGGGKFAPVEEFEPGKIYVIEFWATWCGPCKAGMPHLVELQQQYADRDVIIVGVSDESLETVSEFLTREVPQGNAEASDDSQTYGELTSAYCLATDPDRSVMKDYFRAAGRTGIPCAFVVGKDAKIEWIGHPGKMDEVLDAVVNDKWDREAFAQAFKIEQLEAKLKQTVDAVLKKGDVDEMKALVEKLKGIEIGEAFAPTIEKKIATLEEVIVAKALLADPEAAVAEIKSGKLGYRGLNLLASQVIKDDSAGDAVSAELALALAVSLEAELAGIPMKGANLIVLPSKYSRIARLYYLGGDLDKAIELCETSLELQDESIAKSEEKSGAKAPRMLSLLRRGTVQTLKKYQTERDAKQAETSPNGDEE